MLKNFQHTAKEKFGEHEKKMLKTIWSDGG